jgi:hypothetical protein
MIAGNTRELIELGVIRHSDPSPTMYFRGFYYKIFKDARSIVRSKNFKSLKQYQKHMDMCGIVGVPDYPEIVYKKNGWVDIYDWIGLKVKNKKRLSKKKKKKFDKKLKKINLLKNNKFRELLKKRMTKALKSIKLIGNLSNTSYYNFGESDTKDIITKLKHSLKALNKRFKNGK